MDTKDMSPARFADTLDIGRAVISHILNGRNNPSLDVVMRILNKMPDISSDWLLTGEGSMSKSEINNSNEPIIRQAASLPDLFAQIQPENSIKVNNNTEEIEYRKENIVNNTENLSQDIVKERIIYKELPQKAIKQIIIYYTDNTFETFNRE